jgi:predicted nucleotidyltransferase
VLQVGTGDERQQEVIARAQKLLPEDERILAVYLIGSYGTAQADRFSDVDVHLVIGHDSVEWFEQHWDDVLRKLTGRPC